MESMRPYENCESERAIKDSQMFMWSCAVEKKMFINICNVYSAEFNNFYNKKFNF